MKTGRLLLLLALVIISIVIYVNKCGKEKIDIPVQTKQGQPMMVSGFIVSTQTIENKIYASGTILANEEVEIRNEIPGKITAIIFREGTRVRKGDLLLTLYDEDLLAQLKKLELQKSIAEKNEERQKDLLTVSGISQQEYDLSLNQLATLKADIELLNSQLSKASIKAPFDGIIGLKTVSTGAYLAANTRIATIQSVNPVKLEFAIPERYRPMINDTTQINFTSESSDGIFNGKIYAFEPKIDLQTRSVMVRALCPNNDFKLFPGAFANIEIPLKKVEKAILVPTQALIPELKGQKIFITKNGKAEKVDVETGIRNDSAIQITSGLTVGDTVLITGILQMKAGMPLKVRLNDSSIIK